MPPLARALRRYARLPGTETAADPVDGLAPTPVETVAGTVRAAAFWAGICLPALHVPLFLAIGLTDRTAPFLAGLWALHGVALALGSRHDPHV